MPANVVKQLAAARAGGRCCACRLCSVLQQAAGKQQFPRLAVADPMPMLIAHGRQGITAG